MASAFSQNPVSQTKPAGASKPTRNDSVEVVVHLSPEEVEDGKLNDAYQSILQQQKQGKCTTDIIERYKSQVIPLAEKSGFNIPRNKFLFMANTDIGSCYLAQQEFVLAEAFFQKVLQYAPVWPGTNDSAYPMNYRRIATAQMGQNKWQSAEESLQKSLSLFDQQIDSAIKSDSAFSRTEHAASLRGSKAVTLTYLGIVYMREGRTVEALQIVDVAFAEASKPTVSPAVRRSVIEIGHSVAEATGDKDAIAKWSQRN